MGLRRHTERASTRKRHLELDGPSAGPSFFYLLHEFSRKLASRHRTLRSNRQLGGLLAVVAGAVIAGAVMTVARYTTQITGAVAAIAHDSALATVSVALAGLVALAAFMSGATATAGLIDWARRRNMHGKFALALLLEAALLLVFGLVGANLEAFAHLLVPVAVLLLCFIMGLQNAIVTKISQAQLRTSPGPAPDPAIAPARRCDGSQGATASEHPIAKTRRDKRFIPRPLVFLFLLGALTGALAFTVMGWGATLPIVLLLVGLAAPSISADIRLS